jgi:two-component system phosphate regulon sensor histidine kinase PhoR
MGLFRGIRGRLGEPAARGAESAEMAATPAPEDALVRALIEALPDAALLLDTRGEVRLCNGAALRLLDCPQPRGPLSFVIRTPEVHDAIARARQGEAVTVRYRERVPVERSIEAHVAPLDIADGGILLVLRDLTQMEQLERMRADFVANASHELRTPLASLSGFIETLQGPARDDPDARRRFLAIMQTQARRMSRLIGDLLSLSRIERDERIRPDSHVDLAEIAALVRDSLRAMAAEEGVDIILDCPAPLPIVGAADELARLVENLVDNAIKYAASGKRIVLSAKIEPGSEREQAVLCVRDFGPGIAAEHLPRLAERFYRVDANESRAKGGTGLGLALVKHIVNRHRAFLLIESTPGEGTSVTVRFDLAEQPAEAVA